MFTDGLDTSALQWVRKISQQCIRVLSETKKSIARIWALEGLCEKPPLVTQLEQAARPATTPRQCSTPASVRGSPDITRYDYPSRTNAAKAWGLPPPQLSSVYLHEHALRPPFDPHRTATDDLEESIGSISGHYHRPRPRGHSYDLGFDDYDSGDEQESGLYTPSDSSPSGASAEIAATKAGDHRGPPRLPDRAQVEDYYDGPLSRKNSFGKKEGSSLKRDVSGRRDESGVSRKNSFDLRDGRHGAYTGSGRFDPYYGRRDEAAVAKETRAGAYTGSGRFDPEYTGNGKRGSSLVSDDDDDQNLSSATELSDDSVDTEDDEESEESEVPPRRAPVKVKTAGGVAYPKIEGYEPVKKEYRPPQKEVENSISGGQRWSATAAIPMQSNKVTEPALPHAQMNTAGGPPSAPPFFDVPGAPEASVDASLPGGSSIGGSYVTSYEQQSASAIPCEPSVRSVSTAEEQGVSSKYRGSSSVPPARPAPTSPPPPPVYHSGQTAWQALVAYDACVRLCLRAWARGCMEAPEFLLDECSLLRNCFGLQQLLLQPQEEGSRKGVSEELGDAGAAPMPKRSVGRVKVQVRKLRMTAKPLALRSSSSLSALDTNTVAGAVSPHDFVVEGRSSRHNRPRNKRSLLSSGWSAVARKLRMAPKQSGGVRRNHAQQQSSATSQSQRSMAYVNAGAMYVRQVSGMLKDKVNSLRHSSLAEVPPENFTCLLRLKSTPEQEALRLQSGSGETSILLPENPGDDLLLDVHDVKGNLQGRMTVHVASISDDPNDRVRWYNIYSEPEHECVGKVQLFLSYTLTSGEVDSSKWGPVGETKAYDIVLEVAMRVQQFQRRRLRLEGTWLWLLSEFASCYGVSASYTKLRYLVCIMEVATPTEDCLVLIHDLLRPIVKARDENSLNRQEKRLLVDVQEQVEQLLAVVFENYKSLDEDSISGLADISAPVRGSVAPALIPAVQIYILLHDILSPESQNTLRNYFKTAAMKRCKRLMMETDEFVSGASEGFLMDPLSMASAYQKMRALCLNIRSEVRADIEIHNKHVLPSSIDLTNIAANIYDVELSNRLRAFLVACPPSAPSPPVAELMLSTADFQQDLVSWRIKTQRGVNAKELFHLYIVLWIQDKRLHLLDLCKFDKERTWVTTQHTTSPSVEEVYDRIKDTLNEYEVIISRWPEYTVVLESAVADVERAVIGALEKQYAEVLLPLKDVMIPKKFSLQYMQKLTRQQKLTIYSVPSQLGVMLNSLKRLLDTLRPRIESQMKTWVACLPEPGGGPDRAVFGERLNEVTIELRAKYKNYLQSIVEKLADNARLQRTTKLKRILQDTREAGGESDIRERMQPLNTQLVDTISHLHDVFTTRVFVAVCRGFWDRMAKDVLHFLENRKGNRSWYKGSSFALGILDDVFATQMQRLQGRALQEKDLEPPRSVAEARSMLSRDAQNGTDSSSLFFY